MNVSDIMTTDVVTIDVDASVADALEIFHDLPIRHLPVVSASGELVGMISDRDLRSLGLVALVTSDRSVELVAKLQAKVSTVMSADVFCVTPESDVVDVIDLLLEEKVGAVPVVEEHEDELVGMVSYVDVLRGIREQMEESEESEAD